MGVPSEVSYRRLFELVENKLVTVADAKVMGWGESKRLRGGIGAYLRGRQWQSH